MVKVKKSDRQIVDACFSEASGQWDDAALHKLFAKQRDTIESLEVDAERLVALLTKALGDIGAALTLAGKEDQVGKWTADYVAAINAHDAQHGGKHG